MCTLHHPESLPLPLKSQPLTQLPLTHLDLALHSFGATVVIAIPAFTRLQRKQATNMDTTKMLTLLFIIE